MQIDQQGLIGWVPAEPDVGDHSVEIHVSDGRGGIAIQSYMMTVTIPNHNPVITSEPIVNSPTRLDYTYQVLAQDEDGDTLTYSLITAPENMSISGDGLITWTPDLEGDYIIDILVRDDQSGSSSQTYTLTIFPRPNTAPTISSIPETDTWVGSTYTYQIVASDPESDPISFALISSPEQVSLNPETGLLNWTTMTADKGSHEITFQAIDDLGAFSTQTFNLNVNALPNVAPAAQNQSISLPQDGSSNLVLSGYDADQDPLVFTIIQTPKFGSILGSAPNLKYIPNKSFVGQDSLYFVVSDQARTSSPAKIDITVVPVNHAPNIISQPPSLAVKQGDDFVYPVQVEDLDGDMLSFALTAPSSASITSSGTITFDTCFKV